MRNDRKKSSLRRYWVPTICLAIVFLAAFAHGQELYRGKLHLFADQSFIVLPDGIEGLVFDTLAAEGPRASWRQIGDLTVDSLITREGIIEVSETDQMLGIDIPSATLRRAIDSLNIYSLRELFPGAHPRDTLYWNEIRQRWFSLPDLSGYYVVRFGLEQPVERVREALSEIDGLSKIAAVHIPIPDAADPCTAYVPNDPDCTPGKQWHLFPKDSTGSGGVGAICAWGEMADSAAMGRGTHVAVLGEGMAPHPEIVPQIDTLYSDTTREEEFDHETGIGGIIAATTFNDTMIAGVAPLCKLIDINMFDTVRYADRVSALWYAIDTSLPTDVVSYSYHSAAADPDMRDALEVAFARNIVVVVSAGTESAGNPVPFRAYPAMWGDEGLVVTVAAHANWGGGGWYPKSNYPATDTSAQFLTVAAPGYRVFTISQSDTTGFASGTSFAVPVVAGLMAIAKGIEPRFTPPHLSQLLEQTCDTTGLSADSLRKFGAGRVDGHAFIIEAIHNTSMREGPYARMLSVGDSLDCLIVADSSLRAAWQTLADAKTKRGVRTEVATVQWIVANYSGSDTAEKIRTCIEDYYDNSGIEYVILGGSHSEVPSRHVYNDLYGPGVQLPSDFYYACLDGDWNYDSDTLFGESEDSVDFTPEVAVGRLECVNRNETNCFIIRPPAGPVWVC